jgi:hypothetical protein
MAELKIDKLLDEVKDPAINEILSRLIKRSLALKDASNSNKKRIDNLCEAVFGKVWVDMNSEVIKLMAELKKEQLDT